MQEEDLKGLFSLLLTLYGCCRGFPLGSTLGFYYFHVWDSVYFSILGLLFTWIRGLFDGVKPTKGQDCGRSSFSYIYDRDRGSMERIRRS